MLVAGLTAGGTPPKSQFLEVGLPVEASLNDTPSGAQPAMGVAFIFATGACAKTVQTVTSSKRGNNSSFLFNG